MKGYGQFCPVAKAAELIAERWTPLVLRELLCGSRRFNDIRKGAPLMSPSLLAQRLRTLEAAGILERVSAGERQGYEYRLTPAGEELRPLIEGLGVWGQRWVRSRLTGDELDVGLLMWDIRRRVDLQHFPERRAVIAFEFSDAPASKRHWWLVGDRDGIELCLTDPGFDVDLYVLTDVRTLTMVWMGDMSPDHALQSGRLDLYGSPELRKTVKLWFRLNALAGVKSQRG